MDGDMGKEFRARSGRTVTEREDGSVMLGKAHGYLSRETVMDAEEYFQAKRDDELGRWRWTENPDYVVYMPAGLSHYVRVLNEREAILEVIHRVHLDGRGSLMAQAARAYFDAHPERRPWESAEPGEVWLLTINGVEQPAIVDDDYDFSTINETFAFGSDDMRAVEDAHRIFPVAS